jgi:SRSO17 transposase
VIADLETKAALISVWSASHGNFTTHQDRVMIIDHLPSFLKRFFTPLQAQVSKPQYGHLWTLVLGMIVNVRSSKLVHLSRVTPRSTHRTAHGSFLNHADADVPALLEQRTCAALAAMKPQAGETIYLILDDHRIAKRGRKMARISKIWEHKSQRFVRGHIVLFAAICFRGVVLPWRLTLQKPKGQPGPRYRKLTDLAAQMIRAFAPPASGMKVRVLFDAFYLCPALTRACESKGYSYFSVAAKNRCFRATQARGRGRQIGLLAPGLLRHRGKNVRMKRSRGVAKLRIASLDGHLSRIGAVHMVLSKRPGERWRTTVAIVTSEAGLDARQIVSIYELRWNIEVLFKELEVDLGLGDYQVLSEEGILKHLHLCCLAHLVLTHHAMEGVGAQARKANKKVCLPTMNQRLEKLRSEIRREQVQKLFRQGGSHERVRERIEQYLRAA